MYVFFVKKDGNYKDQLAEAFEASQESTDEEMTAASVCSAHAVFTVPSRDNSDTTEERSFYIT